MHLCASRKFVIRGEDGVNRIQIVCIGKMNRTFLPPLKNNSDKLTECTLSDEIHDNLRVLAFMYPFSEELEKVFERVSQCYDDSLRM